MVVKSIASAFKIPSDVDDSSVNLSLGRLLFNHRNKFSKSYEAWNEVNKDYQKYFDLVKKYAYRPFLSQ